MLEGYLTYPGLETIITATIPLHHGITPNVISVECAPQRALPERVGSLTLKYGENTIVMPDCVLDSTQFTFDQRGNLWALKLKDYRWRWQNQNNLQGRYNVRLPNGPIDRLDPLTEKNFKELLTYCTKKIKLPNGKKFIVVGDMPKVNPAIYWAYANPAVELQQLCEKYGFRIVPQFDGNVYICPKAYSLDGKTLASMPKGLPTKNDNSGYDPPEMPDKLIFVTGPTRYQFTLPLEAVADDTDGMIKPLDQISYKPANGWLADVENFYNVSIVKDLTKWYNLPNPRELARASVFKKYRIRVLDQTGKPFCESTYVHQGRRAPSQTIYIPGCPVTVKDIRQLLPIGQELLEPVKQDFSGSANINGDIQENNLQGWYRNLPFVIWGQFVRGLENNIKNEDVGDDDDYDVIPKILVASRNPLNGQLLDGINEATYLQPETYSMDTETGIVTINGPMYGRIFRYDKDGKHAPAKLWCRGTCQVSDWGTWVPVREEYPRSVTPPSGPKLGGGDYYIQDRDLFLRVVPVYNDDQISLKEVTDNAEKVKEFADYELDSAIKQYQDLKPASAQYVGWWPIKLDGGIEEVVYTLGPEGAYTHCNLFNERYILSMGYEERRFYQQAADERTDPKKKALLDLIREKDMPYSRASGATRGSR